MAIEVEVRGFTGIYASLNAAASSHPVGMAELVNKAITVGGLVHGSPLERSRRRSGIVNIVLSSVRAAGAPSASSALAVTGLYASTETTEKAGISFRLGMALAAVVGGRVLGTSVLKHVNARSGGRGRRADLVGLDASRARHVVEAKARTYGLDREVRDDAKRQAAETRARLAAGGTAIATTSASLADLSRSPIFVLFEDPPPAEAEGPLKRFDEDDFLRDYYSPVPDLISAVGVQPSGYDRIDDAAIGAWLPGADTWLGLTREVYQRLQIGEDPLGDPSNGAQETPLGDDWLTSVTSDGHVLVLGPRALLSADDARSGEPAS